MATSLDDFMAEDEQDDFNRQMPDNPLDRLAEFMAADNIAEMLSDEELGEIGARVVREYKVDKNSRSDWEDDQAEAMDLAMQVAEEKNYPWPKAANVKYPLLTSASIQFAARAYPAIVNGPEIVRCKVNGADPNGEKAKRGERISRHMSWQLSDEMEEWEEETDKLLHVLPIVGMAYRKSYFNPETGRNCAELVTADKLVVNDNCKDLATTPRITHLLDPLHPFEIKQRERQGLWLEREYGRAADSDDDEDAPHQFLEQHRRLDLDEDGYPEPYIVTVHEATAQVVRIVANYKQRDIAVNQQGEIAKIDRERIFTPYGFLPNPRGGWHCIGFGYLLRPLNEAVNTTLNQMLDAGTLQNTGGGFIGRGARLRGGVIRTRPGEWKPVDVGGDNLRNNMVAFQHPGPSVVLFQLLGLLIDAAKDISSVKDVMTGETQGRNESPTTTLALIEQGMQVFSAIYKRIFRSLRKELQIQYRLNSLYLDPDTYFTLLDETEAVGPQDYELEDLDVIPVADPNTVTNMQRLGRAQWLMQFAADPWFNGREIRQRMLEAASIDGIDDLLVEQPPGDPKVAEAADKMDIEKRRLHLDQIELEGKLTKIEAEVLKLVAEAEGVEPGQQIEALKTIMRELNERAKIIVQGQGNVDRGRAPGVEGQPGNGGVPALPGGAPSPLDGAMGLG